jgi:RNA polymerase primary sigma factor
MGNKRRKQIPRTNEKDIYEIYMDNIDKHPLLSYEQEKEYAKRIQQGDKKAVEELIESNLKLVVKIARKFNSKFPLDLIQEGNLGLIRAVESYDGSVRFSTYAGYWIKQRIFKALGKSRLIKIPFRWEREIQHIKNEKYNLIKSGEKPTLENLSKKTYLNENHILNILTSSRDLLELDKSKKETTSNIENRVPYTDISDRRFSADKIALDNDKNNQINLLLRRILTSREAKVIKLRYGLNNHKKHTFKQIADEIGVSRQRAGQLKIKAIKKLGNSQCKRILKDYLYK